MSGNLKIIPDPEFYTRFYQVIISIQGMPAKIWVYKNISLTNMILPPDPQHDPNSRLIVNNRIPVVVSFMIEHNAPLRKSIFKKAQFGIYGYRYKLYVLIINATTRTYGSQFNFIDGV